jgi:hypothetical protein
LVASCTLLTNFSAGSPYQKEDYDDYEGGEEAPEEVVQMVTPQFVTTPLTLMVNEGDVIR